MATKDYNIQTGQFINVNNIVYDEATGQTVYQKLWELSDTNYDEISANELTVNEKITVPEPVNDSDPVTLKYFNDNTAGGDGTLISSNDTLKDLIVMTKEEFEQAELAGELTPGMSVYVKDGIGETGEEAVSVVADTSITLQVGSSSIKITDTSVDINPPIAGGTGDISSTNDSVSDIITMSNEEFDLALGEGTLSPGQLINIPEEDAAQINTTVIPLGTIIASPLSDVTGFLLCNGREVSRTEYKDLYEKLGDTYGAGDGTTTFNIPDFRGMFLRGLGGNSEALGVEQAEHLPNILGEIKNVQRVNYDTETNQALSAIFENNSTAGNGNNRGIFTLEINASLMNYGTDANPIQIYTDDPLKQHVTPVNQAINYFIKAKLDSYTENLRNLDEEIEDLRDTLASTPYTNSTDSIIKAGLNIDLTYTDNTITIKAGSTVCYPNGSIITLAEDVSRTDLSGYGNQLIMLDNDANFIFSGMQTVVHSSGDRDPLESDSGERWYNYTTKTFWARQPDEWSIWNVSIPVAQVSLDDNKIINVQKLDYVSYFGKTTWVLPGTEYLNVMGLNEDGTLKSEKVVVTNLIQRDTPYKYSDTNLYLVGNSLVSNEFTYDEINNYYVSPDYTFPDNIRFCTNIGYQESNGTVLSGFFLKKPFKNANLQDNITAATSTWSSEKIEKTIKDSIPEIPDIIPLDARRSGYNNPDFSFVDLPFDLYNRPSRRHFLHIILYEQYGDWTRSIPKENLLVQNFDVYIGCQLFNHLQIEQPFYVPPRFLPFNDKSLPYTIFLEYGEGSAGFMSPNISLTVYNPGSSGSTLNSTYITGYVDEVANV